MSNAFGTPQTVAQQAPLSMGFSRRKYWSGLPFPSPGDLPNAGIEPCLLSPLHLQVDSLPLSATWETLNEILMASNTKTQRCKCHVQKE